eukprot:TRINITY_DN4336_c0_g1_i1.p2 TRINITY_DN4336_c0_g1~~TRINITY_DN4336_c0_g1_i1.p2  ORF type:complete len:147 (-),score=37.72 TRINITY_DN4336_c0_g1_i1:28-468(-)
MYINDNRQIGIGLTLFGSLFLLLGIMLFFDKALLALGNFLFLGGITLLIGVEKTTKFFLRTGKLRGTICFLGGMFLVLIGWAVIGMIVEIFGIINLFGNFFPFVVVTLRALPVIGPILRIPVVEDIVNRLMGTLLPTTNGPRNTRE